MCPCIRSAALTIALTRRWWTNTAYVRLSDAIGFATNGENKNLTRRYHSATLVEAEKLQCLGGQVINEPFLGGFDGETDIAEISGSNIGNSGIDGIRRRRIEDGRIYAVEAQIE